MRNPATPQRAMRARRRAGLGDHAGRTAVTAEQVAALAWRLTARDRWIIRMIHEHRVLTTDQLTAMAFPSERSGQIRLRELFLASVLDRFQPYTPAGAVAHHHVLGPAGAAVLAAEHGIDIAALGYRRERVNAIAHSLRLAHTVGVNDFFTALIAPTNPTASARPYGSRVTAWWSETRCTRLFGDLVRPDAYGRYTPTRPGHGREVEFFLEYDTGTEALGRLAGKLPGYAALAAATAITTPLLVWLPTARREVGVRRLLRHAWAGLDLPRTVPLATAAADLLDPADPHAGPADPVWLPLDPQTSGRLPLAALADAWPWLPPPHTGEQADDVLVPAPMASRDVERQLPAPTPMPPLPHRSPSDSARDG